MLVITKLPNTQTFEIVIPTRPIAYLYMCVSSIQRGSDLALLLYQNVISQVDNPENVVGYNNESGSLVVQPNKQSKVKSIQNMESWTDECISKHTGACCKGTGACGTGAGIGAGACT
jgi:hypothetical protein